MKTRFVCLRRYDINNSVLRTEDKDLLFLHGYLSSGKAFYLQTKYFGRDFNVYAPDLKGFGDNADMPFPYSLDDYISEVKEYIYKTGLKKPSVIAHSFGARIAIKAAATDGNAFNKLVLTGAAGLKPRFSLKKSIKKGVFKTLRTFLPKEKLETFYSSDYRNLSPVMRQSFIRIVNEFLDDKIKFVKNRTLLVFGEKDRETPVYMAKKMLKDLENGRLLTIKNAGHFCFLDKPNKFNTEVKEFLLS